MRRNGTVTGRRQTTIYGQRTSGYTWAYSSDNDTSHITSMLHLSCTNLSLLKNTFRYAGATMILVTLHQHCTSAVPNLYCLKELFTITSLGLCAVRNSCDHLNHTGQSDAGNKLVVYLQSTPGQAHILGSFSWS